MTNIYPKKPGFKTGGTSEEAAEKIAAEAPNIRAACLKVLKDHRLTADEVAEFLGKSPFSIRPRISELVRQGLVVDSGERRQNNAWSGVEAAVWRVANAQEIELANHRIEALLELLAEQD